MDKKNNYWIVQSFVKILRNFWIDKTIIIHVSHVCRARRGRKDRGAAFVYLFPFFFFFFCVCVFPRPREIGPPLFVAVLRWSRFSVMLVLRRSRHGPKPTRKQTRHCVLRCSTGSMFHRSDLSNYETSIPVFIVNRWSQFRNQSKFEYSFSLMCELWIYIYIYWWWCYMQRKRIIIFW